MALHEALERLFDRLDLSVNEAATALEEIIDTDVDPVLISAFLVALRVKGETPAEVAGLVKTMRSRAIPVTPEATGLIDIVGTGGSGTDRANISTTAAFVLAGSGLPVAKHGNRSNSTKSGAADVLEALGIRLDLDAVQVARCIDEAGIGFIFAPAFHPAMAKVMPVRRSLGSRTVFNILGPLTNPARPSFQLVGVGTDDLVELVAGALAELGIERAIVVHGAGPADELTCAGDCIAFFVEDGSYERRDLSAADAGLEPNPIDAIRGGEPSDNAATLRGVLEGKPGPVADAVLFNAGVALIVAGRVESVVDGVERAREVIASGDALAALERLVALNATF